MVHLTPNRSRRPAQLDCGPQTSGNPSVLDRWKQWRTNENHCCAGPPVRLKKSCSPLYRRLAGPWNRGIIAHQTPHFRWSPKHVNNKGPSVLAQTSPEVTSRVKNSDRFWKYISFGTYVWFLRQIDQAMQNYNIVKLAQFWRSFSLFTTSSLPRRNFVLRGSFLLKIYTYLPKLMYFQILLKDFVRNVYLEGVWANTDGPLLFTCFGGRRKCGVWWAIMPWFQGPARWEWGLYCWKKWSPVKVLEDQ